MMMGPGLFQLARSASRTPGPEASRACRPCPCAPAPAAQLPRAEPVGERRFDRVDRSVANGEHLVTERLILAVSRQRVPEHLVDLALFPIASRTSHSRSSIRVERWFLSRSQAPNGSIARNCFSCGSRLGVGCAG